MYIMKLHATTPILYATNNFKNLVQNYLYKTIKNIFYFTFFEFVFIIIFVVMFVVEFCVILARNAMFKIKKRSHNLVIKFSYVIDTVHIYSRKQS